MDENFDETQTLGETQNENENEGNYSAPVDVEKYLSDPENNAKFLRMVTNDLNRRADSLSDEERIALVEILIARDGK